jgi:hypothetical protein
MKPFAMPPSKQLHPPLGRRVSITRVLALALITGTLASSLRAQTTGQTNVEPMKNTYKLLPIQRIPSPGLPLPISLSTSVTLKSSQPGNPLTPPSDTHIHWTVGEAGGGSLTPKEGGATSLDFLQPFVKQSDSTSRKITVTATYLTPKREDDPSPSGEEGTTPPPPFAEVHCSPQTIEVERVYLDFLIAETEQVTDDVLVVRDEKAQPGPSDKKVIHWAKVVVKHSAGVPLPIKLESSGTKQLYFYGEQQEGKRLDPNQLQEEPNLSGETFKTLEKSFSNEDWFWIGTKEKGSGQGKFKATANAGTGYKNAPEEKTVELVPVSILVDANRDGSINEEDAGRATDETPYVFWINDDNDEHEEPHFGDVSGQGVDNADTVVNGARDLVDFFPIQLLMEKVLAMLPANEYSYWISHPMGALRFMEMPNVQPSSQRLSGAGSYLADESVAAEAMTRPLRETAGQGSELTPEYLDAVKNGKGVLLFESSSATNQSFELIITKKSDNSEMARVPSEAWMNLVPVEHMYWQANIRSVANGGAPGEVTAPANARFRDSRKDRWFVFCHGYNVSEEAARGWNAEIFKRLHHCGSNARFLGISWEGNQGQIGLQIPFLEGKTPDYWQNVDNAFRSSGALAQIVNNLVGSSNKVIAGHSLGNMLVSSAICDKGLVADHYFMLNAAVAREAYSSAHIATDRDSVRNERWKDYPTRLWPSDYWNLGFAANDARKKLKWQGRFAPLKNSTNPHNYYSTGEEVLKNGDSTTPGLLTDVIFKGEGAWIKQEMGKGEATKKFATGITNRNWSSSGGWALNWQSYSNYQPNPLQQPNQIRSTDELTNEELKTEPFFNPFRDFDGQSIHGASGSALASLPRNRSYLLAHDIPAISNPAGSNPISFDDDTNNTDPLKNTNMQQRFKMGNWGNWKHSDLKNESMDHVGRLFIDIVSKGNLE